MKNLSDAEYNQLQKDGWMLVCADTEFDKTIIYQFKKVC